MADRKEIQKYLEITKDKIIVKTPKPYVIPREGRIDLENVETDKEFHYSMVQHLKFLYECLRVLGISKKEAIEKSYSLNTSTGDKLMARASAKEISYEMQTLIRNHRW